MATNNLSDMTRRLNEAFAPMFRQMEQEQREREEAAAKANPAKFKLSRTMERGKPTSARYWGIVKDKRGRKISYCWSAHRNVAGYFIGWREVETPVKRKRAPKPGDVLSTVKRDQWTARKVKKRLEELQKRRTDALRARLAK